MRTILLASALALGSAAYAQDTTPAPTMPPPSATMPATPDAAAPPAATMPATPDAAAPPAAAPDGAAPMTPSTPDQGAPPPAAAAPADTPTPPAPAAAATDDSNLPTCSRTVTDKCVQKAGSGHHMTKHHAAKKKAPK